jgi:molybdopterin molybdotransferase
MLDLTQAQSHILAAIHPLGDEVVALQDASNRVSAETISSPVDLPLFDNSAMDGYALRAEDLVNARSHHPVCLRIVGQAPAGAAFTGAVTTGNCVRLFTGSLLPVGANAVVMQEETRKDPFDPEVIWFCTCPKPWENVRSRGEDVRRGVILLEKGSPLTIGRISLLAAVGLGLVRVGKRPVVGVLATGSELRESGEALSSGQIYESNRVTLAALLRKVGARPRIYPFARDTLTGTQPALLAALQECDAVLTSGGVSVGEFDFVKAAFEQAGGTLDFWRVSMKPGKPFAFGQFQGKCLFGLPGNPVSAFVTFLLLVRPALLRVQGATDVELPSRPGILEEPLSNRGDRTHFMRVEIDDNGLVRSTGAQASHMLSPLAKANGLVGVPKETCWERGTTVKVLTWD